MTLRQRLVEAVGQVLGHPADARERVGQAGAAQHLEQVEHVLAVAEADGEEGLRAQVHDVHAQPQDVVGETAELGRDGADVAARGAAPPRP